MNNASTVIQVINQQLNIIAPASAGSSNWDCHICSLPETGNIGLGLSVNQVPADVSANVFRQTNDVPGKFFNLLNIVAVPAGQDTMPTGNTWNETTTDVRSMNVSSQAVGQSRIVGFGFEVHNTTAELYKQGQLTSYRMPQRLDTTAAQVVRWVGPGGGRYLVGDVNPGSGSTVAPGGDPIVLGCPNTVTLESNMPPATLGQATLFPGSQTWEAKEGAYVVATKCQTDNPLRARQPHRRVFRNVAQSANYGIAYPDTGGTSNTWNDTTPVFNGSFGTTPMCLPVPFNTSGVFLTGLSPQTTLTVYLRVILEVAPTADNTSLITLAQPPVPWDPLALDLYAAVAQQLPPAVMVSENPEGEWWDKVLAIASKVLPGISAPLNGIIPGLGTVANGLGSAAQMSLANRAANRKAGNMASGAARGKALVEADMAEAMAWAKKAVKEAKKPPPSNKPKSKKRQNAPAVK